MIILHPKSGTARIDVLDVLRGFAILLIFLLNVPGMGNSVYFILGDARLLGWNTPDKICWWILEVFVQGTQRGLLELLFGAGTVILLERTLRPDGPVAVADLFVRRNLWLAAFGLFDIFGLFWFGDILLSYASMALVLFPFRRLRARTLLALSLLCLAGVTIQGAISYRRDVAVQAAAAHAVDKQAHHQALDAADRQALAARQKELAPFHLPPPVFAAERAARFGPLSAYRRWMLDIWEGPLKYGLRLNANFELFYSMLFGMALFKFGVIQGRRSARFYAWLALVTYTFGLAERALGAWQLTGFQASPNIETIAGQLARLAVIVGHVALVNLAMKSLVGKRVLAPFKAAGRTAFSLYLIQNFLGDVVLFPRIGFGLWGRYQWFGLTMIGLVVIAAELVLANLWLRYFAMGPLEWIWRSLSYQRLQPMRHRLTEPDPVVV